MSHSTVHASEFYTACREGNLSKVDGLLKAMTTRDINKVEEANNSTALHAASFYGHSNIVKRLLEVGANIHTRNGYGNTAEQEAQTQDIKNIFEQFKKHKS